MCGVLGLVSHEPVNQMLYDGLQMLQHRGQDAAGIVTAEGNIFSYAQGQRHGARSVPYPQYARLGR